MNIKTTIIKLFILLAFFTFGIQSAEAHIPSHDPYGRETYRREVREYEYCDSVGTTLGAQFGTICRNQQDIRARAIETKNKEVCNELRPQIVAWREIVGSAYENDFGEDRIQGDIQGCQEGVESYITSFSLVTPPGSVRSFDQSILFASSVFSLIYLIAILWLKKVRRWKLIWLIVFHAVILVIVLIVAGISQLGTVGPVIPSLHDFLFFQQRYLLSILITGVITSLLSLGLVRLALLLLKKETVPSDRRSISFFYVLVFNPFFFPVGPILGLIHLIYAYKASRIVSLPNQITPQ